MDAHFKGEGYTVICKCFTVSRTAVRHCKAQGDKLCQKQTWVWSKLWSDETKFELFVHMDVAFVCQRKGEAFNAKNTVARVKQGGGSINAVGLFCWRELKINVHARKPRNLD